MKMKLLAALSLAFAALLGAASSAQAQWNRFSFGVSFGSGGYYAPYRYYTYYPGYFGPAYCPPPYAYGVYNPGTLLGIRHYVPYRPPVYRSYIPRDRFYYRGNRPYSTRRYYRRSVNAW